MSATASRSAELLGQIAASLGVPVATFTAPPTPPTEIVSADHVGALWFDPQGRRLAAAFARLPRPARASLANVAEALGASIGSAPTDQVTGERGR